MGSIYLGAKFSSTDSLDEAVKCYEVSTNACYWKSVSKTLVACASKCRRIQNAPPELKYYMIIYSCVSGGRNHRKKIKTGTRNSKTLRRGCPAAFQLLLSEDAKHLVVNKFNEDHNHQVSRKIFRSLPQSRRLSPSCEDMVRNYMGLHVNKKLLQEKIHREKGKLITLRDINNIVARKKEMIHSAEETWINYKCEAKAKAGDNLEHLKGTGGGPPADPLPVIFEKMVQLIEPVLITGDDSVDEPGRFTQESEVLTDNFAIDEDEETPVPEVPSTSKPNLTTKSPSSHRKRTAKGFNNMLEVESQKVEALNNIARFIEQKNQLQDEANILYRQRTDAFINIANAFLERWNT